MKEFGIDLEFKVIEGNDIAQVIEALANTGISIKFKKYTHLTSRIRFNKNNRFWTVFEPNYKGVYALTSRQLKSLEQLSNVLEVIEQLEQNNVIFVDSDCEFELIFNGEKLEFSQLKQVILDLIFNEEKFGQPTNDKFKSNLEIVNSRLDSVLNLSLDTAEWLNGMITNADYFCKVKVNFSQLISMRFQSTLKKAKILQWLTLAQEIADQAISN